MKILHTGDWHIGKKLHKQDLNADFQLFINWLGKEVKKQNIDVLLISGDIFDLANPSNEAKSLYYTSLLKLSNLELQIIIIGGNHDSPSLLNAPKSILNALNVSVIGSLPEHLEEALIPISSKNGKIELIVAAIPFLRNKDIQNTEVAKTYEERLQNLKEGINTYYHQAAELAAKKYPNLPCIAMGHLFTHGVSTSESERDIQIGNQAGVEASQFSTYFKYIALGHIHKPQQVNAEIPIYYSGSPIQLSFSERKDEKRVLMIDTENGFEPKSIAVPNFRNLIKLKGNLIKIEQELSSLEVNHQLTHFIEIELIEEKYNPEVIFQLNHLIENFTTAGYSIVKHRIYFKERQNTLSEATQPGQNLDEMKAKDVFEKRIAKTELDQEMQKSLMSNFEVLLQEVQEKE